MKALPTHDLQCVQGFRKASRSSLSGLRSRFLRRTGGAVKLDIRLLGSIEVYCDDVRVDLHGTRQRTMLAYLALTPGAPRHLDGLIDALWPVANVPAEPRQAVHTYASRLRRAIGPDVVKPSGGGYELAVSPRDVDVTRFEDLIRQAARSGLTKSQQLDLLNSSLTLWRGQALDSVQTEDWARADAVRLEEMRATALEDRAQALIDLQRPGEAIADMEAAAERTPLRERTRSLLMTLLDGTGRQAEALRVYHEYRYRLSTDLGLDPGEHIAAVERAIATRENIDVSRPSRRVATLPPSTRSPAQTATTSSATLHYG
jgi:DNA-binding SARP family transcriptional activator